MVLRKCIRYANLAKRKFSIHYYFQFYFTDWLFRFNIFRFIFITLFFIFYIIYHIYIVNNINEDDVLYDSKSVPKFRWCSLGFDGNYANLVNCESLFKGNNETIEIAKTWQLPCSFNDSEIAKISENCTALKTEFLYWSRIKEHIRISRTQYSDSDSSEFPLAFVIIVAKNAEQTLRLFQSIYLKSNLYCITYDNATSDFVKTTLHNLDKCFDNVFMPEEFVNVYWAGFSILQSAMNCLKVLVHQKRHKWKYVQILSWNDYPLKTNLEMIEIMQIFNGSQDCILDEHQTFRSRQYYNVSSSYGKPEDFLVQSKQRSLKPIPPGSIIEYKGGLANTMTRDFVGFLFENPIARQFYEWANTSYMAEEMYFSTLIHNLHLNPPGGFPGACLSVYADILKTPKPYVSRYQTWSYFKDQECKGKWAYDSCVFGVGDLSTLMTRPELIAHKVYIDFEPATYYCLAELHYNRTVYPESYSNLNISFYEEFPFVRYQRLEDKSLFEC